MVGRVKHFCYICKVNFIRATDYILHTHQEQHKPYKEEKNDRVQKS